MRKHEVHPLLRGLIAISLCVLSSALLATNVCTVGTGGTGTMHGPGTGGTGFNPAIGTGGTGRSFSANPGTGGTGVSPQEIGTGGTGIIGVITGFASVCVNSIEAEFDNQTVVVENGATSSVNNLRVGQVVEVLAVGDGERVYARNIQVKDTLMGPITRLDVANGRVEVMHQVIQWGDSTVAVGADLLRITPKDLNLGQFVRISGFRAANGTVVASRIEPTAAGQVRLSGTVTQTRAGEIKVQGVAVRVATSDAGSLHGDVSVVGNWEGSGINAERVESTPTTLFDGKVARVSVQGFVGERLPDGTLRFGNTQVRLNAETEFDGGVRDAVQPGEFIQIDGQLDSNAEVRAQKIRFGDRLPRPERSDQTEQRNESSGGIDASDTGNSAGGRDSIGSGSPGSGSDSDRGRDLGGGNSGGERDLGGGGNSGGGRDVSDRGNSGGGRTRDSRPETRMDSGSGPGPRDAPARVERVDPVRVERVRIERVDVSRPATDGPPSRDTTRVDHSGKGP